MSVETELKIQDLRQQLKHKHRLLQAAIGTRQLAWDQIKRQSPTATLYSADFTSARQRAEAAGKKVHGLEKEIAKLELEIQRLDRPGLL